MTNKIAVTIVTGFLGAGKSTLVEHWLGELPASETAVIVNEQGEVGIDGALIQARTSRLREITGGCICCETRAALERALTDFAQSDSPPRRILIETSGAASPAGVIHVLTHSFVRTAVRLDGVISVLHGIRARESLAFPLTVEQLAFSDIVVLSHADTCSPAQLAQAANLASQFAPGAHIASARKGMLVGPGGAYTLLDLLELRGSTLHRLDGSVANIARHGFDAVSLCWDGDISEDAFIGWVETTLAPIEARITRLKAIVAIEGIEAQIIVHGVGSTMEVRVGSPWGDTQHSGKLVIIGLGLDADDLRTSFAAAVGIDEIGTDA